MANLKGARPGDEQRHGSSVCRRTVGREREHTNGKEGKTKGFDCLILTRLSDGVFIDKYTTHETREEERKVGQSA